MIAQAGDIVRFNREPQRASRSIRRGLIPLLIERDAYRLRLIAYSWGFAPLLQQ